MRRIMIAVAVIVALTTSAQAQVDKLEFPGRPDMQILACVTPFHYDEGLALWNSGQSDKVNPNTCGFLDGGTPVTVVDTIDDYYARVMVELNGKMVRLFVGDIMLAGKTAERKKYREDYEREQKQRDANEKAKQDEDREKRAKEQAAAETKRIIEQNEQERRGNKILELANKANRCASLHNDYDFQHPVCAAIVARISKLQADQRNAAQR